jgi:branched-chain amino acid transport system ATP-binding protein
MLIVEQSTERALEVADRLYVMRSGRIVLSGRSEEIAASGGMEEAYFGVGSEDGDSS